MPAALSILMAAQVVPDLIRPLSLIYSGLHLHVLFLQMARPLAFSNKILMSSIYHGGADENQTHFFPFSAEGLITTNTTAPSKRQKLERLFFACCHYTTLRYGRSGRNRTFYSFLE